MNVKEWNDVHQLNDVDGWARGHPRRSYGVFYNG